LSKERNEPPDIDVDFEHDRREEVLQYVFQRYGRHRAALTAVVSSYHAAGAVRDVAKALGLPPDQINALADCCGRWSDDAPPLERLREAGFDPHSPILRRVLSLTQQLIGFPRHLSQHPGGFVISEHRSTPWCRWKTPPWPSAPSSSGTRTTSTPSACSRWTSSPWACSARSAAVSTCCAAIVVATWPWRRSPGRPGHLRDDQQGRHHRRVPDRVAGADVDAARLKPRTFYDLVIEVAIVRPGPIQGGMVHPYLRRRNNEEPATYPSPELETVLKRTLGVPLFQEQVMQIAMVAADYSPGEADQLRRSMAAWKRHGGLEPHQARLRNGMLKNGYSEAFAAQIFEQIKGFGSYGFPESHAASFALLTYASCWLKCHEPAAFACALINSWPMGFYSPDQILQDARRHRLQVRPVDVLASDWDCSLEPIDGAQPAIRLGLRMIAGFREEDGRRIEAARQRRIQRCRRPGRARRAGCPRPGVAGGCRSLAGPGR
jgi:error-prone DNA polymerase